MNYREEYMNLFAVPDDYYLVHCISADVAMGKGIAVEFNKRFDMKNKIQKERQDYLRFYQENNIKGDCIPIDRVLNLITKERYYQKPTYKSLRCALCLANSYIITCKIKKIAMPIIGCGLDRLEWSKVSDIIKEVFNDTDVEILVCKQPNKNMLRK